VEAPSSISRVTSDDCNVRWANCASARRWRRARSPSSCARPSAAIGFANGIVYVQVTRGVARRDFSFPPRDTVPSLVVTARSFDLAGNERRAARGMR